MVRNYLSEVFTKNCCVRLFFQDYISVTPIWQPYPSIFFQNFKRFRKKTLHLLPEPQDLPTSLLCFVLFTGFLLSRESSTKSRALAISDQAPTYLSHPLHFYVPSRQLRSSADTRVFRYHPFAQSQVVNALPLSKLQQHGTNSPHLPVTHPLSVPSILP